MASFTLRCSGVLALVATGLLWPQSLRAASFAPESLANLKPLSQRIAREPVASKATPKNLNPESANAPQSQDGVAREILLQVQGTLAEGDHVFQDGSLYVPHTLEGKAGDLIQIRLESTDFDTYLILQGPDGSQVAQNDDFLGTNSWIVIELPETGRYQILANSYNASGRGDYQLTVRTATRRDLTVTATVTQCRSPISAGLSAVPAQPVSSGPSCLGAGAGSLHQRCSAGYFSLGKPSRPGHVTGKYRSGIRRPGGL
jgi:hypothetical protein